MADIEKDNDLGSPDDGSDTTSSQGPVEPDHEPQAVDGAAPEQNAPAAPAEDAPPVESSEAPAATSEPPAGSPAEPEAPAEDAPPVESSEASAATSEQPAGSPAEPASAPGSASADDAETAPDDAHRKPKISRARQARLSSLYRAYRSNRPIEGTIEGVIKGGYELRLGKVRAFCPHSQIDVHRVENPDEQVGKKYLFRITQLRRGGEDIVVSRRAVLEDERKEEAKAVRATLIEGAVMQGHVAGLADFGAFVDLGAGVMGLVHVSELAHRHVTRVADAVAVGDTVSVKILKLDDRSKRISLSIRQAQEDPWQAVADRFEPGKLYPGTVKRLADFGAFVELAPGIEALAPASEFPPSRTGWRQELEPGTSREWLVLSTDPEQHRISIIPTAEGVDLGTVPEVEPGTSLTGQVQRVEDFGVFVWLGPGQVGLMPNVWSGAPRGEDMARRFPVGDEVEVNVVEVSDGGRRIRLARKGTDVSAQPDDRERGRGRRPRRESRRSDREGRPERPPAQVADASTGGSFGTILADKLRAALGRPDDDDSGDESS